MKCTKVVKFLPLLTVLF